MKKFLISSVVLLSAPFLAFAQLGDFTTALGTLTDWMNTLLPMVLLLAVLFFFWGLTMFILKAGDEEARKSARSIMIWGVVAIFVMVSLWGLVNFLGETADLDLTAQPVPTVPGAN